MMRIVGVFGPVPMVNSDTALAQFDLQRRVSDPEAMVQHLARLRQERVARMSIGHD